MRNSRLLRLISKTFLVWCFLDVYEFAYDWIGWNYYFVDDGRELIFMCNLKLTKCTSIVDIDVSKPRGIALDPTKG